MSNRGDEPLADDPWIAAKGQYENPKTNLKALAASLNTGVHALVAYARKHGWALRSGAAKKAKAENTRQTIGRLKDLLHKRLGQLEGQLDQIEEEVTAISNERDIRAVNTLVRTLEKVLELERKERAARSRKAKDRRNFDDAERDELSQRIKALCKAPEGSRAQPDARPAPGAADPGRLAPLGQAASADPAR